MCADADKAEKPTAYETADDTKEEVDDKTIAAATLQLACDVARKETDDDRIEHNMIFEV